MTKITRISIGLGYVCAAVFDRSLLKMHADAITMPNMAITNFHAGSAEYPAFTLRWGPNI
nr:hypothetical protein [Candidatus Sigynarchaeota archaeon]